jgi:hypothetical protein
MNIKSFVLIRVDVIEQKHGVFEVHVKTKRPKANYQVLPLDLPLTAYVEVSKGLLSRGKSKLQLSTDLLLHHSHLLVC